MSWLTNISGSPIVGAFRDGYQIWEILRGNIDTLNAKFFTGTGSPEGVVAAARSSIYFQTDATDGATLWTKTSGSGNTGWSSVMVSLTTNTNVLMSTTILSDAQIKALPTTSIQLVAAPGAGKRIEAWAASIYIDTTAGGYTNIDSAFAVLCTHYGTDRTKQLTNTLFNDNTVVYGDGVTPVTALTDFLGPTDTQFVRLPGTGYVDDFPTGAQGGLLSFSMSAVDATDLPVKIGLNNSSSGNLTGGNVANSMRVRFMYQIVDVP